jgi:hypothetical protein
LFVIGEMVVIVSTDILLAIEPILVENRKYQRIRWGGMKINEES